MLSTRSLNDVGFSSFGSSVYRIVMVLHNTVKSTFLERGKVLT